MRNRVGRPEARRRGRVFASHALHGPRPPPRSVTRPLAPLPCRLAQNGSTSLLIVSATGHMEVAQLLLERGAAVNAVKTVRD